MADNTKDVSRSSEPASTPGPFLAKVISHLDPTYMGGLEVELLRASGNDHSEGQLHQVKYLSPFCGATGVEQVGKDPNDYNNTQKSYGMWMVPPDPGCTVVVIFIDGDPKRGFWIGCVQDENMNFMTPGIASTENTIIEEKYKNTIKNGSRVPVAEYNKQINKETSDPTKFKKPIHPFAAVLVTSGLDKDDTRGITTSSARRETPSMVFGISTPGPIDKQNGAKQGTIGKKEHAIKNAYVSRLGGSTFVMDDGDDKFVREKKPSEAGPTYIPVEQGKTAKDHTMPHNELVRIRTRTGHQILLHNSEDLIYISHGSGNSWIEMTANGKIDVYSKDSISMHSEQDINFTAGRDINFTTIAGNVSTNATGKILETSSGTNETKAGGNIIETAPQIHMNGPAAAVAPKTNRIPTKEPWAGHENLDPTLVTPAKTKSVVTPPPKPVVPAMFKKYTTTTDTFNKVKPPEKKK
jgi:hypothetical protein